MRFQYFNKKNLKHCLKMVMLLVLLVNVGVLPEILKLNGLFSEQNVSFVFDCESSETSGNTNDCDKDSIEDISDCLLLHPGKLDSITLSQDSNLYSKSSVFISFDGLDINSPPPEFRLV